MLLSTLGATGMGSMLKIAGGAFQGISEAKAAKERRELVRDMQAKRLPVSSGDSSNSQVEAKSPLQSLLDTSLLSQSPLWER